MKRESPNDNRVAERRARWFHALLLGLVLCQVGVVLLSWLWTAAFPESPMHSMLSDSGIRWFFGTFTANLCQPLLLWIILFDIACSTVRASGLWTALHALLIRPRGLDPQQWSGLRAALVVLALETAVILLLVVPFHAVLLSVTGHVFPSSFSQGLLPAISFMIITAAFAHGLFSGQLHNYHDLFRCACSGGHGLKMFLVTYVLATELYCMIGYVWG